MLNKGYNRAHLWVHFSWWKRGGGESSGGCSNYCRPQHSTVFSTLKVATAITAAPVVSEPVLAPTDTGSCDSSTKFDSSPNAVFFSTDGEVLTNRDGYLINPTDRSILTTEDG